MVRVAVGQHPLDRAEVREPLDGVVGLVLGEFTDCEEKDATFTAREVLHELVSALGVPVLDETGLRELLAAAPAA